MSRRIPVATRFWSKVDLSDPDGCWLWKGSRRHTYGEVWVDGEKQYAHRVAYALVHGAVPPGLFVCHRCDTPLCVRPDHLFAGTQGDNIRDCAAKGRQRGTFADRPPRGEQNSQAKLTWADVDRIRALAAGGMSQYAIAEQFGVAQTNVSAIVRGVAWRRRAAS